MIGSDNVAGLPSEAFPQQPISQPIDTLGAAIQQPAAPIDAQATFDQLIATTGAELGLTLGASATQNLIDLGASAAALGQVDPSQPGIQIPINLDTSNSRTLGDPQADAASQIASLPNAAPSTSTAIDTREVGEVDRDRDRDRDRGRDRERDRDREDRQVLFRTLSPRLAEDRFRYGSQ